MERFECNIGDTQVIVECSRIRYSTEEYCGWEIEDIRVYHNDKEIMINSKTLDDLRDQIIEQVKKEI